VLALPASVRHLVVMSGVPLIFPKVIPVIPSVLRVALAVAGASGGCQCCWLRSPRVPFRRFPRQGCCRPRGPSLSVVCSLGCSLI
jgi:hypothetical protein